MVAVFVLDCCVITSDYALTHSRHLCNHLSEDRQAPAERPSLVLHIHVWVFGVGEGWVALPWAMDIDETMQTVCQCKYVCKYVNVICMLQVPHCECWLYYMCSVMVPVDDGFGIMVVSGCSG